MQSTNTPLRLIQVGMGGWGRDWATHVITHSVDVEHVACVDVEPTMLRQVQEQIQIPAERCFTSLDAALATVDADAVLVTAALPGHVPIALESLAAGKHVLIEKPFAPSLADAEAVVEAARAANRILMISQNYRYYPAVRAVAKLIREQVLGPVSAVNVQFRKYANTAPRGNHRHYEIVHPLLMDMSIHHFDLMRCVLHQEPTSIICHAWNPPWSNFRDPAAATATITFDGGAVVNYQGNWTSTAPATLWGGEWRIECEGGEIIWTTRDDRTLNSESASIRPFGKRARRVALPVLEHWDRAGSLAAFVAAIRAGEDPETSGSENVGSLALMFAAIASAESRQPQLIAQPALAT